MAYRRDPEGAGGSIPRLLVVSGMVLTLRVSQHHRDKLVRTGENLEIVWWW